MNQYNISSLALDPVVNFGKVTVSPIGYTTETAIALLADHGTRLPDPSPLVDGPFNLVWYNSSQYADPADDPNVEIVRCIIKAVDSIVIDRGQENTSISNKNSVGDTYKMILAPTKKMFTDIPIDAQSRVNSSVGTHAALTTGVHGAGASTIETITGSQAKVDAHKDLTTGVHGAGASTIETIAGSQSKVDTYAALTPGKVGVFTRDISLASGTQQITGVGFAPRMVIFFSTLYRTSGGVSFGLDGIGTIGTVDQSLGGLFEYVANYTIFFDITGGWYGGLITATNSDGFTVTWTKGNSPTGIATINFMAFR